MRNVVVVLVVGVVVAAVAVAVVDVVAAAADLGDGTAGAVGDVAGAVEARRESLFLPEVAAGRYRQQTRLLDRVPEEPEAVEDFAGNY